jgi:hypothetical protein
MSGTILLCKKKKKKKKRKEKSRQIIFECTCLPRVTIPRPRGRKESIPTRDSTTLQSTIKQKVFRTKQNNETCFSRSFATLQRLFVEDQSPFKESCEIDGTFPRFFFFFQQTHNRTCFAWENTACSELTMFKREELALSKEEEKERRESVRSLICNQNSRRTKPSTIVFVNYKNVNSVLAQKLSWITELKNEQTWNLLTLFSKSIMAIRCQSFTPAHEFKKTLNSKTTLLYLFQSSSSLSSKRLVS